MNTGANRPPVKQVAGLEIQSRLILGVIPAHVVELPVTGGVRADKYKLACIRPEYFPEGSTATFKHVDNA